MSFCPVSLAPVDRDQVQLRRKGKLYSLTEEWRDGRLLYSTGSPLKGLGWCCFIGFWQREGWSHCGSGGCSTSAHGSPSLAVTQSRFALGTLIRHVRWEAPAHGALQASKTRINTEEVGRYPLDSILFFPGPHWALLGTLPLGCGSLGPTEEHILLVSTSSCTCVSAEANGLGPKVRYWHVSDVRVGPARRVWWAAGLFVGGLLHQLLFWCA